MTRSLLLQKLKTLLTKSVIMETKDQPSEFISPISFVLNLMLILVLFGTWKGLVSSKWKMETIYTKLDIKDAYYSVPVFEDHQSLLKFQYIHSLFKFNALPNGYTGPRKFTKLSKLLAFLGWLLGFTELRSSKKFEILLYVLVLLAASWKNITFFREERNASFFLIFTMKMRIWVRIQL